MTKAIVETRGSFMLMGSLHSGEDAVPYDRPAVVVRTYYIDSKIGAAIDGGLKLLIDNLPDEANDADWAATYEATKSGEGFEATYDLELALASYRAELDMPAETDAETAEREAADAAEAKRLEAEEKVKNKPNDTANVAPKGGNETARAAVKTHQAPKEG